METVENNIKFEEVVVEEQPKKKRKWIVFVVLGVILAGLTAGGGYFFYEWKNRFLVDPVVDEQNKILSHPDNFLLDRSIPVPSP